MTTIDDQDVPASVWHDALLQAVSIAPIVGRPTPCSIDPHPFFADDPADRAEAAEACLSGCPVLELCGRAALASGERAGVWSGVDLTPARGPGRQGIDQLRARYATPRDGRS